MGKVKIKKPQTPPEVIVEVTNWMRKSVDGVISIKTAKEAIEHFDLAVSEASVRGWLRRRNLSPKHLFQEATELRRKEALETYISMRDIRRNFNNKGVQMIMSVIKNKPILDDNGNVILDEEGKVKKTPTIPNIKDIQAINGLKDAINNFTGLGDLEELEKMEQQASDSIRNFKHKKKMELDKFALEVEKNNFNMDQLKLGSGNKDSKIDKALDKLEEKLTKRFGK